LAVFHGARLLRAYLGPLCRSRDAASSTFMSVPTRSAFSRPAPSSPATRRSRARPEASRPRPSQALAAAPTAGRGRAHHYPSRRRSGCSTLPRLL
jgi:hypothetical protein